jgi:hypothetical protein
VSPREVIRNGRVIVVDTVETGLTPKRAKVKWADRFAKVPLVWAARAAKAAHSPQAMVIIVLQRLTWRAKGAPFPFSNAALAPFGVSRETKRRTLAALEGAGLIKVDRTRTRSPIITVLPLLEEEPE